VVACDEQATTLYLDRTAFYPTSGGQPHDLGTLNGVAVVDVIDEEYRIGHVLAEPLRASEVQGLVDWKRRFDHMQQHTGQHLLSAVLAERFGISTVSFHLGDDAATIDVAGELGDRLAEIEREVNREVCANRAVSVAIEESPVGLRKASERTGPLRVVTIAGIDRSACGGTHVASTGQIGLVLLRKVEKVRQTTRIEFVCGGRAVDRARADFDALSAAGRVLSVGLDQVPASVASVQSRLAIAEKALAKLRIAAAEERGAAAYAAASGDRRIVVAEVAEISEEVRAEAQGFTRTGDAAYLAVAGPAVLLAVSADSGLNAGALFKSAVGPLGGRGGGGKTLAQGTSDNATALVEFLRGQL
jgi:alanyl-tRNA synthetase